MSRELNRSRRYVRTSTQFHIVLISRNDVQILQNVNENVRLKISISFHLRR